MLNRFVKIIPSLVTAIVCCIGQAVAGPPYLTDDPEPTDLGHYELYAFAQGARSSDGTTASWGLDYNYGAAPDLQLTAVFPIAVSLPRGGPDAVGVGNVELAAKYKLLDQSHTGIDLAIFPRLFLPSPSKSVGNRHGAFLLPVWIGRDFGGWSAFGGGGCVLNRGGGSQDFCLTGVVLTKQILPYLTIGGELYRQTADMRGGRPTTVAGAGVTYDLSETYHLMAWFGPGLQARAVDAHFTWYSALEITF